MGVFYGRWFWEIDGVDFSVRTGAGAEQRAFLNRSKVGGPDFSTSLFAVELIDGSRRKVIDLVGYFFVA